uniref:MAD2L1-binding protein n=1 Tax=Trichobilharzia regenti TaxID=157069 RepID=A0AA85KA27_TRIRE|nr:unnamed protein product [Trichobilharzia regenti]
MGGYAALEGGELAEALCDFTGGITEQLSVSLCSKLCEHNVTLQLELTLQNYWPNGLNTTTNYLFEFLLNSFKNNTLIAVSISKNNQLSKQALCSDELVVGHAYAVVAILCHSFDDHKSSKAYSGRYICLANPWDLRTSGFSSDIKDENNLNYFITKENKDGRFWMEFDSFIEVFDTIVLCHTPVAQSCFKSIPALGLLYSNEVNISTTKTTRDECNGTLESCVTSLYSVPVDILCQKRRWFEIRFHNKWSPESDGGCLSYCNSFLKNPKFLITIRNRTGSCLLISLTQKTKRYTIPHSSTTGLFHIGMSLFHVS